MRGWYDSRALGVDGIVGIVIVRGGVIAILGIVDDLGPGLVDMVLHLTILILLCIADLLLLLLFGILLLFVGILLPLLVGILLLPYLLAALLHRKG
jgi:hypothetical protein